MSGASMASAWNPNGADGLLRGNPAFLGKQFTAALVCSAWAFVFTYAALYLINLVTRVKVDESAEERGLDIELHGEEAYLGV
jgi:ammonium transporter, Amt family